MTVRRFQLDALPPDIPTNRVDEQRLAVLRELAIRLPALGIRHELQIVGKGGTLLHLCEGVNRPSIDYDCDTNRVWPKPDQARLLRQALRGLPNVADPLVSNPANRAQPVSFQWSATLADGRTERICSHINARFLPDLNNPEFQRSNLRTHKGIPTYTSRHLYQGKANALMNRNAARDLYDCLYGLTYHIERIDPSTRIQLHDHLAESLSDYLVREWTIDLHKDKTLSGHVEIDTMVLDIINCLETDPVVALHAHPGRTLGFFVDTEADTISLGLARTDDHPFHSLYTCPQAEAASLSEFITATKTDIWATLGVSRPAEGSSVEQLLLTAIITENIEYRNMLARSRSREP